MDNLTHSLIGATFVRTLPKRYQRPELYWASLIGNNIPDADFLVHFWPHSTSLDYLVQHRGYTHTFFLAPVMALIAAWIAKKIARVKPWSLPLVLVAVASILLHIGADFLNSYGVHPFTPFLNRWYYGDAIFIVEPLIWFSLLPFVAREADRSWAKIGWWMTGVCMLFLVWIFPTFTPALSGALTFFFVISAALAYGSPTPLRRTAVTLILLAGTLGTFTYGEARAKAVARGAWQSAAEGTETWLEAASNPAPGNPICWGVWTASRTSTEYRFRAADISLWPSVYPAVECAQFGASHLANLAPSRFPSRASAHWVFDSVLKIADLEDLRGRSEKFRRLLSFARFPFVNRLPNGNVQAGDLRYDREKGLGFAKIEIPAEELKSSTPGKDGPWENPLERGSIVR